MVLGHNVDLTHLGSSIPCPHLHFSDPCLSPHKPPHSLPLEINAGPTALRLPSEALLIRPLLFKISLTAPKLASGFSLVPQDFLYIPLKLHLILRIGDV